MIKIVIASDGDAPGGQHDHDGDDPPLGGARAPGGGSDGRPEYLPFVYRLNGRSSRQLSGWEHGRELLHLLGLHPDMSFVLFERGDGADGRWVQALGSPERMVVEVAAEDGPLRVTRAEGGSPRDDVTSAQGYRVKARAGEMWSVEPVVQIVRAWLTTGSLPPDLGAALVTPLDWR